MAVTITSFTPNTKIVSSDVNTNFTNLKSAVEALQNMQLYRARAYRSGSAQTISNITFTKVQLNAESYDISGNFDSSSNYRFTAPVTGYYLVLAQLEMSQLADNTLMHVSIYKNGAAYSTGRSYNGSDTTHEVTATAHDIIPLSATDYVEMYAYHDSGTSEDVVSNSTRTFMSVQYISS